MSLEVNPHKRKPLSMNLVKNERYRVLVSWEGDHDVDIHAFVCYRENPNDHSQAWSFDDILSTYNVQRRIRGQVVGTLPKQPDGSFSVHNGALVHSPDALDGNDHTGSDPDEYIDIYVDKLPSAKDKGVSVIEIVLLTTIHDESNALRFKDVNNLTITIFDGSDKQVYNNVVSQNFKQFSGLQIGSIILTDAETKFMDVNVGFSCDFNEILSNFS